MIKQYCKVRKQWKVFVYGIVNISYWFNNELDANQFMIDWKNK